MAIITTEEVKLFLDINETTYDDKIELLIPEIEALVKKHCNDTMIDADGNDSYPSGIKRPVSELLRYDLFYRNKQNAASETFADHSVTFENSSAGYPERTIQLLKPFRKVNFI